MAVTPERLINVWGLYMRDWLWVLGRVWPSRHPAVPWRSHGRPPGRALRHTDRAIDNSRGTWDPVTRSHISHAYRFPYAHAYRPPRSSDGHCSQAKYEGDKNEEIGGFLDGSRVYCD